MKDISPGRVARSVLMAPVMKMLDAWPIARSEEAPALDASPPSDGVREDLRSAVVALERSHTTGGEPSEEAAWPTRARARWALVDQFERDGKRYVVAVEARGTGALSPREREILALAAAGRSNKEIAYDLGIAPSTVRVLLARALARLGLRSRNDLPTTRVLP